MCAGYAAATTETEMSPKEKQRLWETQDIANHRKTHQPLGPLYTVCIRMYTLYYIYIIPNIAFR